MLREINPRELTDNVFETIGKDWLLVTVKNGETTNAMTASWGGMGVMWGKPVVFLVLRPQRYTTALLADVNHLSISVLPEQHRQLLTYFGTVSGRDEDKIAKSGLLLSQWQGVPYFADAKTAMICRKLYVQPMEEQCFVDKAQVEEWYPEQDFHLLCVAEIEGVLG